MNKKPGFTLIEVMLYLAIASVIVFGFVTLLFALLETRVKSETITDIDQQQMFVMQLINQEIRNASSVVSPPTGMSDSALILETSSTTTNPIIFQLSSQGFLQMSEAGAVTTTLTDSSIIITDLLFNNYSAPSTPGSIRTGFVMTHVNPSLRQEYTFARQATSTASLRHP